MLDFMMPYLQDCHVLTPERGTGPSRSTMALAWMPPHAQVGNSQLQEH